jgi:hypothetical protein
MAQLTKFFSCLLVQSILRMHFRVQLLAKQMETGMTALA